MPRENSDWKQLEVIVADIQKQLAPDAEVRHDHRVIGKSGRRRKLDVTIAQKIGSFPVFIVFDCKRHKRPVQLKDAAAFAMQLEDVNATLGVMVSSSGFDAGAKAIATQKNIVLQGFRNAGETDWKELLGENAWLILTRVDMPHVNVSAILADSREPATIPFDTPIFDENGEELNTLKEAFWDSWKQMGEHIGDFSGQVFFEGLPSFINMGKGLVQIQSVTLNAKLTAKKYIANLRMAEGSVIEDQDTAKPVYRSLTSQGFDWAETMKSQPGIEIGQEEYQQILLESKVRVDLSKARQYIRIVVQDKGEQAK